MCSESYLHYSQVHTFRSTILSPTMIVRGLLILYSNESLCFDYGYLPTSYHHLTQLFLLRFRCLPYILWIPSKYLRCLQNSTHSLILLPLLHHLFHELPPQNILFRLESRVLLPMHRTMHANFYEQDLNIDYRIVAMLYLQVQSMRLRYYSFCIYMFCWEPRVFLQRILFLLQRHTTIHHLLPYAPILHRHILAHTLFLEQ